MALPRVCSYFAGSSVGAKGCVRGLFGVTDYVLGLLSPGAAESLLVLRWAPRWCQRLRSWFVRCHRLCSWFVKSWLCQEVVRTSLGARWHQRLRSWFVRCHRLCHWFVKSWLCREFVRTSLAPPLVPKATFVVCSVSPILLFVC